MIKFSGVHKSYGRVPVLRDVNLEWEKGQVIGVVGPNGSGKTTLVKCLLGLTAVTKGSIHFNGKLISAPGESAYRAAFGYMPQIGRYPESMKVKQLFDMLPGMRKGTFTEKDEELYHAFHLRDIQEKYLGNLSGGTVQKVSAAMAFLFKPDVLILDEPTAGLDPVAAEILKGKVAKEAASRLIIITSHISNDLDELATHLLFLNEGNVSFFESIDTLKKQHGETRLGRIIYDKMGKKEGVE